MNNARNTRCIVRSVVLKFTGTKRLLKGHLLIHKVIDCVGLVAVGYDSLVAENTNGRIYNKVRVNHFGFIKGLCSYALAVLDKYSVTAVFASSHNEISDNGFLSVGRFSQHDTSAMVGEGVKFLFKS